MLQIGGISSNWYPGVSPVTGSGLVKLFLEYSNETRKDLSSINHKSKHSCKGSQSLYNKGLPKEFPKVYFLCI